MADLANEAEDRLLRRPESADEAADRLLRRSERAALVALLLGAVLFAGTHVAAKLATNSVAPEVITALRLVLSAAVFLLIMVVVPGLGPPPRALLGRLAWCGFLAGPANQALFLSGVRLSHATHAALIYALTPIGVYLLAVALRRERWSTPRLVGACVALAGVAVLLLGGGLGAGTLLGDLLILAGVGAWVLWTLEARALAVRFGGLRITAWVMIAGGLEALLVAPFVVSPGAIAAMPAAAWGQLAYLVLATSVLAYVLWSYALARVEASRAAVFANLQPVGTAILSALLLGEPLGWATVGGGLLVLAGVRLAQRAPRPG